MILYYDEKIKDKIDEYWRDEKDIVPYPENEFEISSIIQELNDYAKDNNISFKARSLNRSFDELQENDKFHFFLTTPEDCYNSNRKSNFDDIGLSLYESVYGEKFSPEILKTNPEGFLETKNPFEYLAAITYALDNEKDLPIALIGSNKNVSPVAEKMVGVKHYCTYVNENGERQNQEIYAITDGFVAKTIQDLKDDTDKMNCRTR